MAKVIRTYGPTVLWHNEFFVINGNIEGIVNRHINNSYGGLTNYVNNKMNGEKKIYYENGNLCSVRYYFDGSFGRSKGYHNNGVIHEIVNYYNDYLHEECKYYDEAGNLYSHVIFKDHVIIQKIL